MKATEIEDGKWNEIGMHTIEITAGGVREQNPYKELHTQTPTIMETQEDIAKIKHTYMSQRGTHEDPIQKIEEGGKTTGIGSTIDPEAPSARHGTQTQEATATRETN